VQGLVQVQQQELEEQVPVSVQVQQQELQEQVPVLVLVLVLRVQL
jgi:hypothetical protein